MENQVGIESQGTQSAGQSPVDQPTPIPPQPGINYRMISTLILGALFLVVLGVNLSGLGILKKGSDVIITPPPPDPPIPPFALLTGTIKTGAQLGEVKSYCTEGLYLVADEGKELIEGTGTKILLLRLPGEPNEPVMLSDPQYVGKKVEVVGKYPAQENFCEALICNCEDYILVDHIDIVDTQAVEKRQTTIEGQIDCLPHRDTSGGETLECAFGLQGKDGMYYGLQGLNQQDLISGKIAPGKKVVITGIFIPSKDSKYNTIGTIEVVSVGYTN